MKFSENWLRTFVNPPLNTRELAQALTMAGVEVEAIEPAAPPFDHVVVGEVLKVERHPDAARLTVCQVGTGGEPFTIVCGAPMLMLDRAAVSSNVRAKASTSHSLDCVP